MNRGHPNDKRRFCRALLNLVTVVKAYYSDYSGAIICLAVVNAQLSDTINEDKRRYN